MRKAMVLLMMLFAIVACGNQQAADNNGSFNGSWKGDGFKATVSDNRIEIHMVGDNVDGLYWVGTFPASPDKIKSVADRAALKGSLVGSTVSEKNFVVKDGKIYFTFTIFKTSRLVELKRI